jgi:hypothetical protein
MPTQSVADRLAEIQASRKHMEEEEAELKVAAEAEE